MDDSKNKNIEQNSDSDKPADHNGRQNTEVSCSHNQEVHEISNEEQSEDDDDKWEDMEEDDNDEDEIFKYILENNIDGVRQKIEEGYNALSVVVYGDMVLHFATLNSKVDVLRLFENQLRNKSEINTVHVKESDECGTALHTAVDGQVSVETLSLLVDWGANVNACDYRGGTPLHELIDIAWNDFEENFDREKYLKTNPQGGQSYLEKLSILQRHGVDMNARHGLTSLTPLQKWCQQFIWCTKNKIKNKESLPKWCFQFLNKMLDYGCDRKLVNERGENHLFNIAQRYYQEDNSRFISDYGKMCELLVQDSDLLQKNINGRTILHETAEFSNIIMIQEIMKYGLDVNATDRFGLTAAHIIAHNITQKEEWLVTGILNILTSHGANLNAVDNHGATPIHHAIHLNNVTAVKYLLDHGADLNMKDLSGLSAMDHASLEGNNKIQNLCGILYLRSNLQTSPGVSNFRTGYFYPQCCHWSGNETSYGEGGEIVKESEIQNYVENFYPCLHNTKFIIQNALHFYDENVEQRDFCFRDWNQLHRELLQVMGRVVENIRSENPLFSCDFILGGSNAEGTKVGAPDEFDFVFILKVLSDKLVPEETEEFKGFVKLKVKETSDIDKETLNPAIIDENGYVKRETLSCHFHKLLEKVLGEKEIFDGTCFESHCGTVNSEGECWDIGQLNLKWYGPFQKRQVLSVDMVPVLQIPTWQTQFLNKDIKLLDSKTLQSVGCFLVMKDCRQEVANLKSTTTDDVEVIKAENKLFQISFSQLENAVISKLPNDIRGGLKVAKTIRIQCPRIGCERVEFSEDGFCDQLITTPDGHFLFVNSVFHYITSYKIKTALLHALDDMKFKTKLGENELKPHQWNEQVTSAQAVPPEENNLKQVLKWSHKIYETMIALVKMYGHVPDYFLSRPFTSTRTQTVQTMLEYSQILSGLNNNFHIPVGYVSSSL